MTARWLRASALSLALVLFPACQSRIDAVKAADLKPDTQRKPAPDFTLKDVDNKPVKLSDYKGKVVLLNFWATWCGPCKIEIPWFMEFERDFKEQGFAVLGVSMDEEGWEVVKPYLERVKVNYRVLLGSDPVATLYGGVESLPTSFLIDRQGRVAAVHVGLVSKSQYRNDLVQLLEKSERAAR